jgi:hypothetical protein
MNIAVVVSIDVVSDVFLRFDPSGFYQEQSDAKPDRGTYQTVELMIDI